MRALGCNIIGRAGHIGPELFSLGGKTAGVPCEKYDALLRQVRR